MNRFKRPESVLVVIHSRAGKVLLLKRADLPDFWQSVTGAMRWDETDPRATAVREVREETGFAVGPSVLRDLRLTQRFPILAQFRHRYAPGVVENVEHALALEVDDEFAPTISPEHIECKWFDVDEAPREVASWTNRDAILAAMRRD